MKKMLRSFTFWFVLASVIIVILNLLKPNAMNLIMIGLNPVLNILSSSKLCSAIADVPYLWHILSIVTMAGYGIIIDLIRTALSKK